MVSVSDTRSRGRRFDSRPAHHQATTLGKLPTPMCLCHQAVQLGTGQRVVMLCGQEGNRRYGITLAMRHRLQWFFDLRAQGHGEEKMSIPPIRSKLEHGPLYLSFIISLVPPPRTMSWRHHSLTHCCA